MHICDEGWARTWGWGFGSRYGHAPTPGPEHDLPGRRIHTMLFVKSTDHMSRSSACYKMQKKSSLS